MLSEVRILFDKNLEDIFLLKPEVKSFLLAHERKDVVLNNLCEQIIKLENYNMKFDASKYRLVIKDIAKMFANTALESKRQELISSNEKIRLREENERLDRLKEEFKEIDI